jgi:hypothetical protein
MAGQYNTESGGCIESRIPYSVTPPFAILLGHGCFALSPRTWYNHSGNSEPSLAAPP